jgi:hypothetical protein
MYWYGIFLCSSEIQTRCTNGLGEVSVTSCCVEDVHLGLKALGWRFLDLPETTAVKFEIILFGVAFDGYKSISSDFLVVGLFLRIAALVCVGHCGRDV